MKKIIFPVIAIVVLLLLLPILGNGVINSTIESRLSTLNTQGISYKIVNNSDSYFRSKKSYIFKISDRDLFVKFLIEQAHQQIPPYVTMMLDGTEIGVDAEYANIPFFDLVSLNIYPVALAEPQMKSLEIDSKDAYKKVTSFLNNKKLLYHIEYDLINMEFHGYLKDVNDTIMLNKDTQVEFSIKGARFSGQGYLMHPDNYRTRVNKIYISIERFSQKIMSLEVERLKSQGEFNSKLEYDTELSFKNFFINVKQDRVNNLVVKVENLTTSFLSELQNSELNAYLNADCTSIEFNYENNILKMNNLLIDTSIDKLDKKSFLEAQKAAEFFEKNQTEVAEKMSLQRGIAFISKGFILNIKQLEFKELLLKKENIGGFHSNMKLQLQADNQLAAKIAKGQTALENIHLNGRVEFSDKLFSELKSYAPMFIILENVAKRVDNRYIFDVKMENSVTKVNGKQL